MIFPNLKVDQLDIKMGQKNIRDMIDATDEEVGALAQKMTDLVEAIATDKVNTTSDVLEFMLSRLIPKEVIILVSASIMTDLKKFMSANRVGELMKLLAILSK